MHLSTSWRQYVCERASSIMMHPMASRMIWSLTLEHVRYLVKDQFTCHHASRALSQSLQEAEMIAVSDHAGELIAQNELYIHQCVWNKPAILYQDNQSTIRLLRNGKSSSDRTKYIKIRYFWLKDRIYWRSHCKEISSSKWDDYWRLCQISRATRRSAMEY